MVRKVRVMLAILCLLCATGTVAQAASYTAYDGNPSNTYITYYRDILAGVPITDNYVVFRSSQYEYIMVTGDLVYNNGLFTSDKECTTYTIATSGNYNQSYSYNIGSITSFVLDSGDEIVYSDLGNYPQLEERGAKYEVLTTILIVAVCVGYVCRCIFRSRKSYC